MSDVAGDLLIIYETEAEPWANYLQSVFTGTIAEAGICCYDIATASSRQDDFLRLAQYTCKLLILSRGMLEGLCQKRRWFLTHVLSPAAHVVVLLCGVESLTPLLELVPLKGDECVQISSEQDAHEYLSIVTDIAKKGTSATAANVNLLTRKLLGSEQKVEEMHSNRACRVRPSIVVVPCRVPRGSSTEVFILLRNEVPGSSAEVEFAGQSHTVRLKPVLWNDKTLCISAPDFPAGNVTVTVYSDGVPLSKAQLQYYSSMEEITCLLARVADPVEFMCQALQLSSAEKLDQKLASMLLEAMPAGSFQGLHSENTPGKVHHHADVPSLLHFAAQFGFRSVSSLLLQCPGAERALRTANRRGQTPIEIAKSHGHKDLHVFMKEALKVFNSSDSGDGSVYEMMCAAGNPSTADVQEELQGNDEEGEEGDVYTPLGVNDDSNTVLNSAKAVVVANRPPAPAPRPESTQGKEDKTPYIAQVFQKKKTQQADADLYSFPTKQAREREDSISPTYDSFKQGHSLQQRVKQQGKLSQPGGGGSNSRDDGDIVYDKINIVHHTPSVAVNESRRRNQMAESFFYSKPLKGQHSSYFGKADKQ